MGQLVYWEWISWIDRHNKPILPCRNMKRQQCQIKYQWHWPCSAQIKTLIQERHLGDIQLTTGNERMCRSKFHHICKMKLPIVYIHNLHRLSNLHNFSADCMCVRTMITEPCVEEHEEGGGSGRKLDLSARWRFRVDCISLWKEVWWEEASWDMYK